jgi:hypothetical protein
MNLAVSVIIPSRDGDRGGNVARLQEDLREQTQAVLEVIVVVGRSPCSRAHNEGAEQAQGDLLVFLDDDVRLGHRRVLEYMVEVFLKESRIGVVGASQIPPLDATPFERRYTGLFPRAVSPIVEGVTDSDMATHAAMAIPRALYMEVGGEPEICWRADDQVLRARVRKRGLRVVLAPRCWVYHPLPGTLSGLVRKRFRDGVAAAHDQQTSPDLIFEIDPEHQAEEVVHSLPRRAARFLGRMGAAPVRGAGTVLAVQGGYAGGYLSYLLGFRPEKPV